MCGSLGPGADAAVCSVAVSVSGDEDAGAFGVAAVWFGRKSCHVRFCSHRSRSKVVIEGVTLICFSVGWFIDRRLYSETFWPGGEDTRVCFVAVLVPMQKGSDAGPSCLAALRPGGRGRRVCTVAVLGTIVEVTYGGLLGSSFGVGL